MIGKVYTMPPQPPVAENTQWFDGGVLAIGVEYRNVDPANLQGTYVGTVIKARVSGEPAPAPFKYFDKGSMATVGHKAAVADAFGLKFTGLIGYVMWGFIHCLYLIGWGNRLGTLYTWARAMWFSNNRGHRVITFEQAGDELSSDLPPSGRPSHTMPTKPAAAEGNSAAPAQLADRPA